MQPRSNRTRNNVAHSRVKHHQLLFSKWNILTLTRKELELAEEAKQNYLDMVGVSSTRRRGSEIMNLDGEWKLFYSGTDPNASHKLCGYNHELSVGRLCIRLDSSRITVY